MFTRGRLKCSFCGKTEAEVSKLVAGPKVYICDTCVSIASRIMNEPPGPAVRYDRMPSTLWRRFTRWLMRAVGVTAVRWKHDRRVFVG